MSKEKNTQRTGGSRIFGCCSGNTIDVTQPITIPAKINTDVVVAGTDGIVNIEKKDKEEKEEKEDERIHKKISVVWEEMIRQIKNKIEKIILEIPSEENYQKLLILVEILELKPKKQQVNLNPFLIKFMNCLESINISDLNLHIKILKIFCKN